MEKLEKRYLIPYLHSDLKCQNINTQTVFVMKGISSRDSIQSNNDVSYGDLTTVKPILRPLSDLTKEKYANIFFPCDCFDEVFGDTPIKNAIDFLKCGNVLELCNDFYFWQKLFEHHFDVFGLIEKGQAVNMNTIQNV